MKELMKNLPIVNLADFTDGFDAVQGVLEKFLNTDIEVVGKGYNLRKEYQPNLITQCLYSAFKTERQAMKIHIGCGGGKSVIFIVSILLAMYYGRASRVVIIAPTIALTRQLELEFMKLYKRFFDHGHIIEGLHLVNVSSDGKSSSPDLDDEDITAEQDDGDERPSKKEMKIVDALADNLGIIRTTTMNHDVLEDLLDEDSPKVFFVCKPSFLKNFRHRVKEADVTIDIAVFDEYHNFISQNTNEAYKKVFEEFAEVCTRRWFFSASKKDGQKMSWKDEIFGFEAGDYKSSQLVEWGYLVKHLRIFFITASQVRGITNVIKEYFIGIKVKHPEKFYREAAVVLSVMLKMAELNITPKAVVFGSAVKFIRLMMENQAFKDKLASMFELMPLMYQIDGSTKSEDREVIFEALRSAANDLATLLLNHSTVKEGIDVTKFNVALIARGMSEHGLQQAIGRIQRIDHDDPSKDTCFLFLFIDGEDAQEVMKKMKKAVTHIHYGIGDWDASIEPLFEDRVSDEGDDVDDYKNLGDLPSDLLGARVAIEEHLIEELEQHRFDLDVEAMADFPENELLDGLGDM